MINFVGMAYAVVIFILASVMIFDHLFWPRENGRRVSLDKLMKHLEQEIKAAEKEGYEGQSVNLGAFGFLIPTFFVALCFIFSK